MRSVNNVTTISSKGKSLVYGLKELWISRELILFFAWRDIKVRYKQTILGAGWAILQPLITAGIFTLFFNRVAKIDTGSISVPYPVFAYLGLAYWGSFASSLSNVSNSILNNSGVINKIYFPRLVPPLAAIALSIVDFIFAIAIFFILLLIYGVHISPLGVAMVIPSLFLCIFAAFSIGLIFAALNAKYRDVRSVLPFIVQALFFMTPVIYPISMIPERFQIYAYINPATGAISTVKAALFNQHIDINGLIVSWLSAVACLIIGVWAFRKAERHFADYL
jgi:lipopolysaccharide transport system permease protein